MTSETKSRIQLNAGVVLILIAGWLLCIGLSLANDSDSTMTLAPHLESAALAHPDIDMLWRIGTCLCVPFFGFGVSLINKAMR